MRAHLRIPQLLAREPIERQEMRVVGHHERFVAADRDAAIGADAAFAENALVPRLAVGPELAPGRRVERVDLVPPGHIHDAVLHDGRRLKRARIARNRKHPCRAEPLHVGRVDQLERTVAIAGEAAVVVRPVRFRRDRFFAIRVAVFREQREFRPFSSSTARDTPTAASSETRSARGRRPS